MLTLSLGFLAVSCWFDPLRNDFCQSPKIVERVHLSRTLSEVEIAEMIVSSFFFFFFF